MGFLNSARTCLICAVSTGLLLSLAWPAAGFAPVLFFALVPLLYAEDLLLSRKSGIKKVFLYSYLAFFIFNLLTTWWVKYASFFGAVAAIVCNALFMAVVFLMFHHTRKRLGNTWGYISLPVYWIAFEFLHMAWDLSWPWLTLGNGFAGWSLMIQWFEFTGVLGGTLWIWIVNLLIYFILNQKYFHISPPGYAGMWKVLLLVIFIPLLYSITRYYTYDEKPDPVKIVVIQPNIDPYNEKFSGMSTAQQLERILSLASKEVDATTDYIIAPETALPEGIWEEEFDDHHHIGMLKKFLAPFPKANWIIGVASNKFYPDSTKKTATARKFTQAPEYYDSYNTAIQIDQEGNVQIHHKSKLVPGVEKMPYPAIFKYLESFAIDLGGISGSLGTQDVPSVFTNPSNRQVAAPVICYESVYGDYMKQYVDQGASLITIITNDGWWSDTPGYRQHLKYGTLRAIEFRRSIARSANTGISCFINQRGDILQPTGWWVPAAISTTINANTDLTLYARTGDIIGKLASVLSIILVGMLHGMIL